MLQSPVFKEVVDSLQALEATRVVFTTLDGALEFAEDGFMIALVLLVILERLLDLSENNFLLQLLLSIEESIKFTKIMLNKLILEHSPLHIFKKLQKSSIMLSHRRIGI